jgi:cell filamentation protein
MYDSVEDEFCYPGTKVLKNLGYFRTQEKLNEFETAMVAIRFDDPLPEGDFDYPHYRAVHHHLFQDVYEWAGQARKTRISKAGSAFCYPENIEKEANKLFAELKQKDFLKNLTARQFAEQGAHFLAELNAIHAFRDGNGRSQLAFFSLLADRAGHPIAVERLADGEMLDAMIASFHGDEKPLTALLLKLTGVSS